MNTDMCNCCNEVWAECNMKHIQLGNHVLNLCPDCYVEYLKSFKSVEIQTLEQETIIDKIRFEIESLERFEIRGKKTPLVNVNKVLKILDKYKTESEK